MGAAYDSDLSAWATEQAALLRAGRLAELDIEHLAEEIEAIGRSDLRCLRRALRETLEGLATLRYSSAQGPRTEWKGCLAKQRAVIEDCLADSPSLKAKMEDLLAPSWTNARRLALIGLEKYGEAPQIPEKNPFPLEAVLDEGFFPEPVRTQTRYRA